jgi:hypothetical protein
MVLNYVVGFVFFILTSWRFIWNHFMVKKIFFNYFYTENLNSHRRFLQKCNHSQSSEFFSKYFSKSPTVLKHYLVDFGSSCTEEVCFPSEPKFFK